MKKKLGKLQLNRETLAALDQTSLQGIAGASTAGNTCPSLCVTMCGPSDSCASQCYFCPTQPPPTHNANC
jgi:hypothetical protein